VGEGGGEKKVLRKGNDYSGKKGKDKSIEEQHHHRSTAKNIHSPAMRDLSFEYMDGKVAICTHTKGGGNKGLYADFGKGGRYY